MLIEIAIAILFAKIFNVLFEKMKQPGVLGEIIAGIVLGPCGLGALSGLSITFFGTTMFNFKFDFTSPEFQEFASIGIIFLLFLVGLETDINGLKKTKKSGVYAGVFGVFMPFILGCLFGFLFGLNYLQCMAIGAIFLASSASITIRIITDMDLLSTRIGLTIHTAIIVNDILAMIIFAVVFGIGNSLVLIVQVLLFFLIAFTLGYIIVHYASSRIRKKNQTPVLVLTLGLLVCFLCAAFAENLGLTAIIGAFIAGLFIRRIPQVAMLVEYIKILGYAFLIPLFFVWVGASFNFLALADSPDLYATVLFIAVYIMLALLGNFLGGAIGSRLSGLSRSESISIGIGMMPIMGVALIIATTGINRGVFGDPTGFLANQIKIATFFLIIVSCLVTPPLLRVSMVSPLLRMIGKTKTKLVRYHHPHCIECGSPLILNATSKKWFCDTCKSYGDTTTKVTRPTPNLRSLAKSDRMIHYVIGAVTIIMLTITIQLSEKTSIIDNLPSIVGVFVGTTLAFLTLRYILSKMKNKSDKIN
ncbi:MAG: cation:proton antiporter [Candidatus Thermoplasmatota archaeon]